ncbi:MAG: ferritin-like domain-containing protein [Chloroflexi bacterium]|nr:ferritin-like domain-containing protein [Chloroflexota bacterium]
MRRETSSSVTIDLEDLGLDDGGHVLIKHALATLQPGQRLAVHGRRPDLPLQLRAWARTQGHAFVPSPAAAGEDRPAVSEAEGVSVQTEPVAVLVRGAAREARWSASSFAGEAEEVYAHPPAQWGLAARGARVEEGAPAFDFALSDKDEVWADSVPRLYAQAAANQWDPAAAVDWAAEFELPPVVETAVVQLMTYLVENENAALLVPARFLAQVHPHFREVLQLLAIQVADEARHVEVFTRRALLRGGPMGSSTAGGQASLQTLLQEPSFALASFLLSVLGEGTFLSLLAFLAEHAPDPVTRRVATLAGQDEARHVAFGLAHLQRHLSIEPGLRASLAKAVERRHDALRSTAGLNEEVFDSLMLLAGGSLTVAGARKGWLAVQQLQADMDEARQRRLQRLGFSPGEAETLSALHTRNFM